MNASSWIDFLPNSFTPVALALANHLWQSTLVACIAGLLTLTLRRNHARARYALWLAASIKFLVPFSLLMALGAHLASLRPATPQHRAAADSLLTVEQINQPFTIDPDFDATPRPIAPAAALSIPDRLATLWKRSPLLPCALTALWLIGFLAVSIRWTMRWRRISAAIQLTEPLHQGREFEILRKMQHLAGLRRSIELRPLPASMEPGVFGLIRPVLLWPQAITTRLGDAHLEAVLAHEVCHVRRRDNLTAAIHMLVEAIFWFHPVVWWLERRLVEERERACDEEVLQLCGERLIYAEGILKVCEFCVETPLACVSGVTGADLKRRIVQILGGRTVLRLTLPKKVFLTATALLVVAVPIVLGQANAAQRIMLAAINSAPRPFRVAAHAMMPLEERHYDALIVEAQSHPDVEGSYVPTMTFSVASIRETHPAPGGHVVGGQALLHSSRVDLENVSLMQLMRMAYEVAPFQIVGGPSWYNTATFDVHANSDPVTDEELAKLTDAQAKLEKLHMFQTLLADRFHLKIHTEMKDGPIFELAVSRGGPKFHQAKPAEAEDGADVKPGMSQDTDADGLIEHANGQTMAGLANWLTLVLRTPVHDKTGLAGQYDYTLHYFMAKNGQPSDDPSKSPSLDVALPNELGLKLDRAHGLVQTLVIDQVEKPSVDGAEMPDASALPVSLAQEKSQTATLKFDVASVHRDKSNRKPSSNVPLGPGGVYRASGEILNATNFNLLDYLEFAYKLTDYQEAALKATLPDWAVYDRFTIEARTDNQNVTKDELRLMMQSLLAERFKLAVHYEERRVPVLALVTVKPGITGPKLQRHPADASCPGFSPHATDVHGTPIPDPPETVPQGFPTFCGGILGVPASAQDRYSFGGRNLPMSFIATSFDSWGHLDRPVVDETGLSGSYDFVLEFTPEPPPKYATIDSGGPRFEEALRKQLGLKLEPKTGSIKFLVLDHVEPPTQN
jgi:bla regulator protein BlaR1